MEGETLVATADTVRDGLIEETEDRFDLYVSVNFFKTLSPREALVLWNLRFWVAAEADTADDEWLEELAEFGVSGERAAAAGRREDNGGWCDAPSRFIQSAAANGCKSARTLPRGMGGAGQKQDPAYLPSGTSRQSSGVTADYRATLILICRRVGFTVKLTEGDVVTLIRPDGTREQLQQGNLFG